ALLKSPIFQRLPAMNLQQVLMSLEDIEIQKGENIFNQGDTGAYYYLIKRGRCSLTRKASAKAKEIKLLELRTNNTFGEDALLSGEPRSMTVTAITDMLLTRIDKERFIKLIKEPALSYIDYPTMLLECEQGKTIAIDIRSADDYNKNHIKGSRNIPFFSLRLSLKELSLENQKVIIICDDGKVSEAAAFVLIKSKIDADILQGGMQDLPKEFEGTALASDNSGAEAPLAVAEQDSHLAANQKAEPAIEASTPDINTASDLEQENQSLKAENKRLTMELEKFKKQYKLLYTQTGKLKNAFDKLQGSK
ncbi:MAG: cyclic nucleotide-binding domain-containing protein, partial [Methyloprofundus sp.]|nr:cyclic nucleotide-binding domain-containing protein [Methyloprofundus sp.]